MSKEGKCMKIRKCLRTFLDESTIHGLPFIAKQNLHPLERIFWGFIVFLGASFAIQLSWSNYKRFSANPTVVTIQKDFRNWDNFFPAATGCLLIRYNEELAEKYIIEKFGINSSHTNYGYYLDFIKTVTNTTYENLHEYYRFENDEKLRNIDFLDLVVSVVPIISGTLSTFETRKKIIWKYVMTELGICITVNSKLSHLLGINVRGVNDSLIKDDFILKCHYLNGLCYARSDADPSALLKLYIHSYLDVVHATIDSPLLIKENEELEINYRMQETTASDRLRDLTPKQRGCRFDNEPLSKEFSSYSSSICFITCRYNLVMKLCKCKPFFYHTLKGKTCDINGMLCVEKHAKNLTQAPISLGCKCPQDCNLIKYLPMPPKRTVWQYGFFEQRITFRWGLLAPTTKYNRDILFGFEDLVVSFGGILALFLGVSFISGIEILMFILESTCNFLMRVNNQIKPSNNVMLVKPSSQRK